MELPTEIWKEIMTYCDNSVNNQIKEMSFQDLLETSKNTDTQIQDRLVEMKSKLNCYDIIKFKRTRCPEVPYAYAMVISKANDTRGGRFTIKVIMLTPSTKNTQYGYYKQIHYDYVVQTILYLSDITFEIVSHFKDTIDANKRIAKSVKVGDVVEITPSLFTCYCRHDCLHYGVVSTKYSYNTIEVQMINYLFNDYGNRKVVLENYAKINTKNVLKRINLDDETDIEDHVIINHKQNLKHYLNHRVKFIDVINSFKEFSSIKLRGKPPKPPTQEVPK